MSAREILEQIRRLPEKERREVAGQILEEFGDIGDDLSPEQIAELDRRAEDALANPGRGKTVEHVFAEIQERLLAKK